MEEQEQIILSYKIYLKSVRSRIINDNKAGYNNSAKLFEGLVIRLYNIFFETDDFASFPKSNNPVIDLKSDKKEIVVSVKAKINNQSQQEIDKTVQEFLKKYEEIRHYKLISQQICDEPKKKISNPGIEIKYFGEIENMFSDDFAKLENIRSFIEKENTKLYDNSYLKMLTDYYLAYSCLKINQFYGVPTFNPSEYQDLLIEDLNVEKYKATNQLFYPEINELWQEIKNKKYLKYKLNPDSIRVLDQLWNIGSGYHRFKPVSLSAINIDLDKAFDNEQKTAEGKFPSTVQYLHNYFVSLNKITIDILKIING